MSTLELRQEMLDMIKNEDDSSLKNLYQLIKSYKQQRQLDKMIAEGEEDIKAGRLHSQSDVQKMIESWVK
ncbi:hypothetical protein [uncultured Tenacibaculum sp.]|uniref:hypothetical protein n=1 Tax=uncultured Tenacibaculum sp. TaxID=174713 RepID=UPI002633948C|nr:hypothetical protein [uncultured Tenacibaculum sp.]